MTKGKIAFCCLSDGRFPNEKQVMDRTFSMARELGYEPVPYPKLFHERGLQSAPAKERASFVNDMFRDPSVKAIMDISGGDLANQCIDYLDFDAIAASDASFWGYSDLTCVINAIHTMTGKSSILMQVTQLARSERLSYMETLLENGSPNLPTDLSFLQGSHMEGVLLGGNIRCLLKLAGTKFFPDLTDKVLFIEGYGNSINSVSALLAQHKSMGTFDRISGLIIGQYTKLDKEEGPHCIENLVLDVVGQDIPVARTHMIGHSTDSLALKIGEYICL